MALHSVMYVCRSIVQCVKPPSPPPPHVNCTSDVRVYLCYTRVIREQCKNVKRLRLQLLTSTRVRMMGGRQAAGFPKGK